MPRSTQLDAGIDFLPRTRGRCIDNTSTENRRQKSVIGPEATGGLAALLSSSPVAVSASRRRRGHGAAYPWHSAQHAQ